MTVAPAALDALMLARWQFGITTVYHFILVPFTIGMSLLVAILQTMWYRTGKDHWLKATRFFGKLFLINFALGVATGIVQEFQFGMNWSEYSRYVGDIFGAPLACEALIAFFLESTFLGIWIFGWGRISAKAHTTCIWLAAAGVNISAMFILAANAWMQHPVGAKINPTTGRAELDGIGGFFKVLTNPAFIWEFSHVITSSWLLAGTFVAGTALWWMVRAQRAGGTDEARLVWRPIARFGLVVLAIGGVLTALTGHVHAQGVFERQPAKMAAAEAMCDSGTNAPFTIAAFGPLDAQCSEITKIGEIPGVYSFLATNSFSGEVQGVNNLDALYAQAFDVPSIAPSIMLTFWSFRLMMGFAIFSAILCIWGLIATSKGRVSDSKGLATWSIISLPMPFLAAIFGWLFAEFGRQPFVVYPINMDPSGVFLRTRDGLSGAVPAGQVLVTMIGFTLIYAALGVVWFLLMRRYIREGIHTTKPITTPEGKANKDALSFAY
ncbi:MAG: cytochrome ubiquinol oxidase subunit I [Actinomycetaceae bacterium]|nr:cytochrome ubiquinol oxidase subunit I [Actinomycetaceae bacterium]